MKNPVRNLAAVSPAVAAEAKAALLALAKAKDPEAAEDASGRVVFTIEWEPAFKDIKEISAKHKDATFTLYSEAFAKQHWVSKAVYQGGKAAEEATLSRIDGDAFRKVYREIFGEEFVEKLTPEPAAR